MQTQVPGPIDRGSSFPLGATPGPHGTNFSVYAKDATAVELLLFGQADDAKPARVIPLDARANRTWHYWHACVPGIGPGQLYGYRVAGPAATGRASRFDASKVLLDPYGRCIASPAGRSRRAAQSPGDNAATAYRSVVADPGAYDWGDDRPPRRTFGDTVIYELHVGAFTRHPNSGLAAGRRGTFAGLIEKIPYLVDLGITAVELLPVFAFDEQAAHGGRPNVWGYQPVSFFAPHPAYCSRREPLAALDEFRDLVKALHRANIEVILDVVYNHTAEGGADGPTYCLRGFADSTYYTPGPDAGTYADFSGCGNSLNANEPVTRRLIVDSLRYWVTAMHVDGFRFDLASVLSRDAQGHALPAPPVLFDIESDPVLANVKLIAEAWDAAGLYQVGRFFGDAWKEWNGQFRDDVRRFVKGDDRSVQSFARRLAGSPDLYGGRAREPEQSVNFVTCHDGFTLNDLVSYDAKHNEANGEDNRDGADANYSWNCGAEGPGGDPAIESLRSRQVPNFLALTILAAGVPMLLMGDEVRRSQQGNNNAYCIDDATTWFDWEGPGRHADLLRFVRLLVRFRLQRALPETGGALTLEALLRARRVEWHGVRLGAPDWSDASHSLAAGIDFDAEGLRLHVMVNAYWEPLGFELPAADAPAGPWRRCIDTSEPSPHDICTFDAAPAVTARALTVPPRSLAVLARRTRPLT